MPYPAGVYRCNINAALAEGEIMTNTVWIRPDSFDAVTINAQQVANRVRDKWAAFILTGQGGALPQQARFADTTQWRDVVAYKVDALGRATEQAVANFDATVKGNAASRLPAQLAIVGTLFTARAGRSGRGRIFLGGLGIGGLAQSGRFAPGTRDALLPALGEFYKGLRDSTTSPDIMRPVVVSPTLGDSFKITRVGMGDVYDTMRSRRNKLIEQRATTVVDAG